jgi:tRNA(Met) C34 N-acetyltransferase TmcA
MASGLGTMTGEKKKSKLRSKPSMKFWLLTLTQNQVMGLAMFKNLLRKRKKRTNYYH